MNARGQLAKVALVVLVTASCTEARGDGHESATPVVPSPADVSPPSPTTSTPHASDRWRPIAGLPAACTARVAVDARSVRPLSRRACATGRERCEHHELEPGARWLRFGLYEPILVDDRGVHVSYLRSAPADERGLSSMSIVQRVDDDAMVEVAFGSPRDCAVVAQASAPGLVVRAIDATTSPPRHHVGWSSWADTATLTTRLVHPGDDAPLSQYAALGEHGVVIEAMDVGGTVRAALLRTGDGHVVHAPELAALQHPLPSKDGLVGLDDGNAAIVHVDHEGTARTVVQRDGARIVAFAIDRADDDTLVWLEQAHPDDVHGTIWSQRSQGVPEEIAAVPMLGPITAHGGWIAAVASHDEVHVLRAGERAHAVPREPDAAWVFPLMVDARDVWVATSKALPGEPGFPAVTGLVRVAHADG